jgi:hypothetical protein
MNAALATFQSPTRGACTFEEVIEYISRYIDPQQVSDYRIIVGSDSSAGTRTQITSVIIVRRVHRGSLYFYTRSHEQAFASFRERIFAEAMGSITLAQEVRARMRDELGDDFFRTNSEIHVDVGTHGPTKELIDAITGIARGYDFTPVIKPESYGAFCVADKYT